jgi:hypothetical protein
VRLAQRQFFLLRLALGGMFAMAPRSATCWRMAFETFIGVRNVAIGKLFEQLGARRAVGNLPTCEHEGDGTALGVSQRVDFRRAAAA